MKFSYKKSEAAFMRRYLVRCLRAAFGRPGDAAKIAGRHRTDFLNLLRKYGIKAKKIRLRYVSTVKTLDEAHTDFSRRFLIRVLQRTGYSPSAAGKLAGLSRSYIYRLAARLGVGLVRQKNANEGNAAWLALREPKRANEAAATRSA